MYDIGARIKQLRGKAITQQQLADAAGVSASLIRALEQSQRHTASIGRLTRIATALDVDLPALLGDRTSVPEGGADSGIVAIRRALSSVDDLIGTETLDESAITLDEARRTLDYAWGTYWAGKYDHLTAVLPPAITQVRGTAHMAGMQESTAAHEVLARIYWVTGCTLVHLGQTDTAWQAIRHAHATAEHGDDELLSATIAGSMSWQLLVQGRYEESREVAVTTADALEPSGDVPMPHLSAYGSLIITAATAAGRDQRLPEARHLVGQAGEVAERIGGDRRDYETYFGPSQVAMQTVDVGVATEDYTGALDAAHAMPHEPGLPLASRCRHLADQAMAHAQLGHKQKALDALLTAESMGTDWIKHQTLPRRIVAELLEEDRQSRLRGLAQRLGVSA